MITISCIKIYSQNSISIYLSQKFIFSNAAWMSRRNQFVGRVVQTSLSSFRLLITRHARKKERKFINDKRYRWAWMRFEREIK